MVKQTIYDGVSYSQLVALKRKIKGSKIVQVSYYDGWRYALNDKRGYRIQVN